MRAQKHARSYFLKSKVHFLHEILMSCFRIQVVSRVNLYRAFQRLYHGIQPHGIGLVIYLTWQSCQYCCINLFQSFLLPWASLENGSSPSLMINGLQQYSQVTCILFPKSKEIYEVLCLFLSDRNESTVTCPLLWRGCPGMPQTSGPLKICQAIESVSCCTCPIRTSRGLAPSCFPRCNQHNVNNIVY